MSPLMKCIFIIIIIIVFIYSYQNAEKDILTDPISKQYKMLEDYLLRDSSLAQSKKPIMWIHIDFNINSRNWINFHSRNTLNLNQPYFYLTLKNIIDKCGDSFEITIIDDSTFSKIIPGWNINMNTLSPPVKNHIRQLAICKLLYLYGGITIPPTIICLDNLFPLYQDTMFVGEFKNNNTFQGSALFMGCKKNCHKMKEFISYLEIINSNDFTSEFDFMQKDNVWINYELHNNNINLISGEILGTKDIYQKPVTIDSLISENLPSFHASCLCVYIDNVELLKRPKFNWFCRLSPEQVLNSNTSIGTLLLQS